MEAGCLFPGGHSNPYLVLPLLPSLGSVITGIPHHLPFLFISFFHQNMAAENGPDTLFSAQVNFLLYYFFFFFNLLILFYFAPKPHCICECSHRSGSSAASLKSDFPFCHKFLHFPVHLLCWESNRVLWMNYLVLFCWCRWVGKVQKNWSELGQRWQGLMQRVKNLDTALLPFPPWAGVELWARIQFNKYNLIKFIKLYNLKSYNLISFNKIGSYQCLCLTETLI